MWSKAAARTSDSALAGCHCRAGCATEGTCDEGTSNDGGQRAFVQTRDRDGLASRYRAAEGTYQQGKPPGRPPLDPELEQWILQLAKDCGGQLMRPELIFSRKTGII
jgi:hypothetical protein